MSSPASPPTHRRRTCLLVGLGCLLLPVAALLLPGLIFKARERAFDAERWRAATAEERGLQVNSLLAQGLLEGKTPAAVRALLGPPSRGDEDDSGDARWIYEVGSMSRARWQYPLVMAVEFEDHQVIQVSVYD